MELLQLAKLCVGRSIWLTVYCEEILEHDEASGLTHIQHLKPFAARCGY